MSRNPRNYWRLGSRFSLTTICLALALASGLQQYAANGPLPEFQVISLSGQNKTSRQLTSRPKWLLLYVEPGCRPCEAALKVMQRDPALSNLAEKAIVVVGGLDVAATQRYAEKYAWLPEAAWFADPNRQAAAALARRGAPVIYGIHDHNLVWSVSGSLSDSNKLAALMLPWIQD